MRDTVARAALWSRARAEVTVGPFQLEVQMVELLLRARLTKILIRRLLCCIAAGRVTMGRCDRLIRVN